MASEAFCGSTSRGSSSSSSTGIGTSTRGDQAKFVGPCRWGEGMGRGGRCNSLRCRIQKHQRKPTSAIGSAPAPMWPTAGVGSGSSGMMLRQIIYRDFLINIHHYLHSGSPGNGYYHIICLAARVALWRRHVGTCRGGRVCVLEWCRRGR